MKLSIIYATGRAEPHLEWFAHGLSLQRREDDVLELIVVDLHGRELADLLYSYDIDMGRIDRISVVSPKPNIWQGKHKVTSVDWWAKASALNTGIALASHDYIAAVDDRCVLGLNWLDAVRVGEIERRSVYCGSYDRLENGARVVDGRRKTSPAGRANCGGGWLYGCTWAMPLEWALDVNGFEEGTDGMGGEDYIFGLNLHNAGRRIDFIPSMLVELERSPHASTGINGHAISPAPKRTDKGVSPNDKSHAALERFGKRKRTEFTPNLREIRAQLSRGESFPIPSPAIDWRDWYDGELVREM